MHIYFTTHNTIICVQHQHTKLEKKTHNFSQSIRIFGQANTSTYNDYDQYFGW